MISNVHATFEDIRNNSDNNEFHNLYSKVNSMAGRAGKAPLTHFFYISNALFLVRPLVA